MLKKLTLWLLPIFILLPFTAASQSETPTYKVAILSNDFMAQEQFSAMEQDLGLKFSYQVYNEFNQILRAISQGYADFAANITYTERRDELFQISSPTNLVYTYLYNNDIPFEDAKVLGYAKGSIISQIIKNEYPDLELVEYNNTDQAIQFLKRGKIDGVVDTINLLEAMLNEGFNATLFNNYIPIAPASLVASNKTDPKVLMRMEEFLHTAKMQRRIRELVERNQYNIRKKSIAELGEQLQIDLTKPIKIKLENRPAFSEYYDENQIRGIAADIVKEVCEIMKANCQIVSKADDKWYDMINELDQGEIDVLAPVGISPSRKDKYHMSRPFFQTEAVVVKRNDYKNNVYNELSELIVEKVGVVKGEYFERVLANALPNKEFITYYDLESEIQGLINGEVDYILLNKIDYNLAVTNSNNTLPIQIDDFFIRTIRTNIGFAFPKTQDGENLSLLFNRALNIVDLHKIVAKYDVSPNWSLILQTQKKNESITSLFFVCMFVVIMIFLYFQYSRSITDEMTKLKNRRALYSKYGSKGLNKGLSLIYLDVNSFKALNDTYGHQLGDEVLITLANRIKDHWKGDAYRIGGDEFVLIGKCKDEEKLKLIEGIARFHVDIDDKPIEVWSSFGIYESTKMTKLDDAMHTADKVMYEHKKTHYQNVRREFDRRQR